MAATKERTKLPLLPVSLLLLGYGLALAASTVLVFETFTAAMASGSLPQVHLNWMYVTSVLSGLFLLAADLVLAFGVGRYRPIVVHPVARAVLIAHGVAMLLPSAAWFGFMASGDVALGTSSLLMLVLSLAAIVVLWRNRGGWPFALAFIVLSYAQHAVAIEQSLTVWFGVDPGPAMSVGFLDRFIPAVAGIVVGLLLLIGTAVWSAFRNRQQPGQALPDDQDSSGLVPGRQIVE